MLITVAGNHNNVLAENKIPKKDTYIYVCQNITCQQLITIENFKKLILGFK